MPDEPEFVSFGKIYRLFRDVIVTEKIDGTNAAIGISDDGLQIWAQSRKRLITPKNDNYGFARWVDEHVESLIAGLGPGLHFGEWWGQGIQRGYGLTEKRFSLFNVERWTGTPIVESGLVHVVPEIGRDVVMRTDYILDVAKILKEHGSFAAPGFMNPEGIVIHHKQSGWNFKYTLDDNDAHKEHGLVGSIELPTDDVSQARIAVAV